MVNLAEGGQLTLSDLETLILIRIIPNELPKVSILFYLHINANG